jgi:hypothetical protein
MYILYTPLVREVILISFIYVWHNDHWSWIEYIAEWKVIHNLFNVIRPVIVTYCYVIIKQSFCEFIIIHFNQPNDCRYAAALLKHHNLHGMHDDAKLFVLIFQSLTWKFVWHNGNVVDSVASLIDISRSWSLTSWTQSFAKTANK